MWKEKKNKMAYVKQLQTLKTEQGVKKQFSLRLFDKFPNG